MKSTLASGVSRTDRITIDADRTIGFLGEALRVYSTPSMVRDIEYASRSLIQDHLDEGDSRPRCAMGSRSWAAAAMCASSSTWPFTASD
jgi:hypothetical protein